MGIPLSLNFDLGSGIPLESKTVKSTIIERDAIPSVQRYEGLNVYVTAESKNYQLQGGILDVNWVEAVTSASIHPAVTLEATATAGGLGLDTQAITFRAATNALTGYATASHITQIEANTLKDTNIPTDLGFSRTPVILTISSDGNSIILPEADTTNSGILGSDKWDEIVANTLKDSNISTNLVEGTATDTTVVIESSDGTNATLLSASTLRAGLLSKVKFDEVVSNTTHQTATGASHSYIDQAVTIAGTPTFANVSSSNNATTNSHLVRLDQMNSAIAGIAYQDSVLDVFDNSVVLPLTPVLGDRYIAGTTALTWTADYIYEYDGAVWVEFVPLQGWAVWLEAYDTNYVYNELLNWVEFGSTVSHNNTSGLNTGDYMHLTSLEFGRISEWDTAYTNRITSLTTTGTSGAATLISNVLNIPTPADGYTPSGTLNTIPFFNTTTTLGDSPLIINTNLTGLQTNNNDASGLYSLALGEGSVASNEYSTSLGYITEASGWAGTAMGQNTTASYTAAVAMGDSTIASGFASIASGTLSVADGDNATAMGRETKADASSSLAIGRNNIGGGNPASWVAEDPVFEIGNGTSSIARANALTVLKNGNTTISGDLTANNLSGTNTGDQDISGFVALAATNIFTANNSFEKDIPALTLFNTTASDAYLSRRNQIIFKGKQSGSEVSTLAMIEVKHFGLNVDDQAGHFSIKVNDGADGDLPTELFQLTGNYGVGIGFQTHPNSNYAISIGTNSTIDGSLGVGIGNNTNVTGDSGIAIGGYSVVSDNFGVAIGYRSDSSGYGATTIGYESNAVGNYSASIGYNTLTTGWFSSAFGQYTNSGAYNSSAFGRYNVGGGGITTWVATEPLFEIGNGTDAGNLSNAVTVLKNGDTTINGSLAVTKVGDLLATKGTNTNVDFTGSGVISYVYGNEANVYNSGGGSITDLYSNVSKATNAVGGTATNIIGGTFDGESSSVAASTYIGGITSNASNNSSGSVTDLIGGAFYAKNLGSATVTRSSAVKATANNGGTGTTTLAIAVDADMTNAGAMTTVHGVRIGEWSNTGTVTNSAGIYLDSTIDIGATTKYAIKSLSTSPSEFAGTVSATNIGTVAALDTNASTSNYLRGDGTWVTPPNDNDNTWRPVTAGGNTLSTAETLAFTAGTNVTITEAAGAVTINSSYTNTNQLTTFSLAGDSGTPETIAHGNTLSILGTAPISTVVSAADTVTISHDAASNDSEAPTSTQLGYGGTFTVDSQSFTASGHANGKTSIEYTLPSSVTTITGNAGTATKWETARSITLSGDVSGTSPTWDGSGNLAFANTVVANDSHTHDGRYYTETESNAKYLLNTTDTLVGDLGVTEDISAGTTARASHTTIKALSADGYNAGFEAYGSVQGTGYAYVGQSLSHGGGMFYNGDGTPPFATGEGADTIGFYRNSASVKEVVFSYSHASNDVTFRGAISATNLSGTNTGDNTVCTSGTATTATDATNADNIRMLTTTGNANYSILFSTTSVAGDKPVYHDSANTCYLNPSTNTIGATTIKATGAISNQSLTLRDNSIENPVTATNEGGVYVSWAGYLGGTTYYRNFRIYDGKNAQIMAIVGSTKATTFYGTITAPDFIGSSDERLKENIVLLSPEKLKTEYKTFNFISDEAKQTRVGVIAQELRENHPEFVRENEDGILAISYVDLHSAEIAYLKGEVERLNKMVTELIAIQ